LAASASLCAAQRPLPADLAALIAKAQVPGPVSVWCAGRFAESDGKAYAVAVPSPLGGGRYFVIGPGARTADLGSYSGAADLSCHTPAEARKLDRSIAQTRTIHGAIKPIRNTTVVCGFVENTRSVCWQHSPQTGAFVQVGEWTT